MGKMGNFKYFSRELDIIALIECIRFSTSWKMISLYFWKTRSVIPNSAKPVFAWNFLPNLGIEIMRGWGDNA